QQLIEDGATGYLVKQTAANDLLKAIREAKKGNAYFSPSISKRLLDQCRDSFSRGGPVKKKTNTLTSREAEVLQLIAEGYANKQIASELAISIKPDQKPNPPVNVSLTQPTTTLPTLPDDASPEEKDLYWLDHIYQGNTQRQLTFRAVLTGGLLGMFMCISNLYTTLKIGWSFG